MTESAPPAIEEEAAEAPGEKKIAMSTLAIWGGVALVVVAAFVVLIVWIARWPEAGPQMAIANIQAAVEKNNKLYERAQNLMANVVFTDDAGQAVAPFSSDVVTSPEQIKLLPPTAPNPKALEDLKQAADSLQKTLDANPSARENVKAVAHKLLSNVLALKGRYYTAKSLTNRTSAANLLTLAEQSIGVMRTQMASIVQYDKLTAMTSDDIETMHNTALANANDLKAKELKVSREIIDLSNNVDKMKDSSAALAGKARAARNESQKAQGQKAIDLLEQALEYEKQIHQLSDNIGDAQDRIRVLVVELRDIGLRAASAREKAVAAKAILDNRNQEKAKRLEERKNCLELLDKSRKSAIDLTEEVLKLCAEVKKDEAEAVRAYGKADEALEAARTGQLPGHEQYEADKADIAMAIANLSTERLLLQERLHLLATSMVGLWPKLSPPQEAPAAAQKLTTYVSDVDKLRSSTITAYRDSAKLYSTAVKSADGKHKWVYQGQLAAAHLGLYRLTGDAGELDTAKSIIAEALQDKESSPYLRPVVELQRLAEGKQPARPAPKLPTTVPATTAPSTNP